MPSQEGVKYDRMQQIAFLEGRGINPFPGETPPRTHLNSEIALNCDALMGQEVAVVGRLVSVRTHGKRVFFDIRDHSGKIQGMLTPAEDGDVSNLELFQGGFGLGDFVGVSGNVMRTRMGEPTVRVRDLSMLSKAILPPPFDKEGGLRDVETRFRQRYLDLMANPDVMERFKFRSRMVEFMRQRFLQNGSYEVQTPIMDTVYGGASAKPFVTHHNAQDMDMFLRISDELYLKRLLVGGMESVFEFSTDFRNEGMDRTHNPEFTQVELYKAYTDYNWMMDMSEHLMADIATNLVGKDQIEYQGQTIDFSTPWKRLSIYDGIREYYGFDPEQISEADIRRIAEEEGINRAETEDVGHLLLELFDKRVSPTLINPTFVIDYPESTSPLTKKHRSKPGLVERFECYIAGMEVMNCYTELNDPRVQRANFEKELRRRFSGDEEAMQIDDDFVIAMEYGMPPMGGIGISIDRFVMIYTNADHIKEVILFPVMKKAQK